MSENHQIVIDIKPDGSMTSEVKGVSGQKCATLSAWVNQLGKVVEDKHTDDYYKEDQQGISTTY